MAPFKDSPRAIGQVLTLRTQERALSSCPRNGPLRIRSCRKVQTAESWFDSVSANELDVNDERNKWKGKEIVDFKVTKFNS